MKTIIGGSISMLMLLSAEACDLNFVVLQQSELPGACRRPYMASAKLYLRSIPKCDEDSELGKVCEGMGKCGTNNRLNNCGRFDFYQRMPDIPCRPGVLNPVPASQLPDECDENLNLDFLRSLRSCHSTALGEMCEADGECGTSNTLNN